MVDNQKKVLNKRVFRELKSNIRSYISIILITILCVSLFTGLFTNYHHFKENVDSVYNSSNVADIFATVNPYRVSGDLLNNDKKFTELLNNKEQLEYDEVEKRLYSDAYVNERKIYLMVSNDSNKISIPANIIKGTYPTGSKGKGVLISESFARRRNYDVGDTITMSVKLSLKDLISNDEEYEEFFRNNVKEGKVDLYNEGEELQLKFVITGIMSHAEALGNLASSPGLLYMNMNVLRSSLSDLLNDTYDTTGNIAITQIVRNLNIYNQYVFKGGNIEKIRNFLNERNVLNYIATRSLMPGNQAVEMDVSQSLSLCYVFPVIFYIVGVLIIIASISKLIDKDKKHIALLNAMGLEKTRIILHYLKIMLSLIFIGGILGLIIGPILIPNVMNIKYGILYVIPKTKHYVFYLEYLICFILIILITTISLLLIIRKYLKTNPMVVIKDSTTKNFNSIILEKIIFFNKHMSYSLKMALRNIKRRFSRSMLVIIGVLGCVALLICGFGIEDTLNHGLELEFSEKINYDLDVLFNTGEVSKEQIYEVSNDILYVEEFQYSVIMATFNGAVVDTTFTILENESTCYKLDCPKEGVTLSKKIADSLNAKIGDKIVIQHSNNSYELEVTNILSMFMSQGIYCRQDAVKDIFKIETNRYYCNVSNDANLEELSSKIELLKNDNDLGVVWCDPVDVKLNNANEALETVRLITLVIKIFAIILAIVVVYNLATLNFKERIREMATMKVLGYGYKDISKTLIYELLILTIIGSLLGMFFGYPLLYGVLSINEPPQINYVYHIKVITYLISLLITCGVSIILNLLISLKINKIEMVESLKSVE